MRYSEGVAKYGEQKKQNILNAVTGAENALSPAQSREDMTMTTNVIKTGGQARVKSRAGGFIAAACAALVIGGGAAAYFSVNAPETTPKAAPAASSSQADETPQALSFEDMVNTSDAVIEVEITSVDLGASTEYYSPHGQCAVYTAKVNGSIFSNRLPLADEITFIQPIDELLTEYHYEFDDSEQTMVHWVPGIMPNEKVLVFLKQSEQEGADWELTTCDSIFTYDNDTHSYKNAVKDGAYGDITGFVLNLFSYQQSDMAEVWARYHDEPYTIEAGYAEDMEDGCVLSVELVDGQYVITVNLKPKEWLSEPDKLEDIDPEQTPLPNEDTDITKLPSVTLNVDDHGTITEGFEGLDIQISELWYVPENHEYGVVTEVKSADSTPLDWDLNSGIDVIYNDLTPFMEATDAENLHISGGWEKEGEPGTLRFLVISEPKADTKVDENAEISFGLNTITVGGKVVASGNFEATFRFDTSDVADVQIMQ